MEIHQIRYFLAVAEELNFTRASERCNVAQPSLSRAIQLIEAELGGLLFHREHRRTHLTELGRMVRPHLEAVYEGLQTTKQVSTDFVRMKRVPLSLGIMSTISPDEIIDMIGNLHTRYQNIEVKLSDASALELRNRMMAGDLEVAIYALPGEEPDERTHVIPLFREQMVIAVSRSHRLAASHGFPVREMNAEPYIHRVNCEFAGFTDRILHEQGVTCTPTYWSERDDWTLAMIAAGLGFGFMPANAVKHPGVVGVPVVEPEFWREVNLVSVRGRRHSPGVGALVREATKKAWFGEQAIAVAEGPKRLDPLQPRPCDLPAARVS